MDRVDERLMTKQGRVARDLARRLVGVEPGVRVPGVVELAEASGVGLGTVQEAMRLLEDVGAAGFRRRGAKGTVLEHAEDELLWFVANVGHFVGVLPLPYSRRYEGLATGLYDLLTEAGVPTSLSYMRGGIRRLEGLSRGGFDFAITSLFTAEAFLRDNPSSLKVVAELGPGSYVVEHRLILADPKKDALEPGMRVGIDRDSADQTMITEMEVKHLEGEVEMLPMTYTQVLSDLEAGRLDAAVWNAEDVNGSQFNVVPLASPEAAALSGENTIAAICVRRGDDFSARVLSNKLDRERLLATQRAVIEGRRVPRY